MSRQKSILVRWVSLLLSLALFHPLAVGSALATAATAGVEAQTQTPDQAAAKVTDFHAQLERTMRSNADFDGRVALLAPAINELLDVATIARISLGRTWRDLEQADRDEFTRLLRDLIAATYADRFDNYNNQQFVTGEAVSAKGGILVKTQLLRQSGEPVRLDYYFRHGLVFNIVADGVSDLSLRRSDYAAILKSAGFNTLLQNIRDKIAVARET